MKIGISALAQQHRRLAPQILAEWERVLLRGDFVDGRHVHDFEQAFAEYCAAAYAVGVANGTDALRLALMALGVGPGDEVVTAANTFIATVEAIAQTGARPVLADIDAGTYNVDPASVERAITPRTKAIVPVHLYGLAADMDALARVASAAGVPLVEDASQAHGALYRGRRVGGLAALACFSFYPSKNLGACGDAGAVVTSDAALAEAARALRNHGSTAAGTHDRPGYNSRLDSLQAAALLVKLAHLDDWNAARRRLAAIYDEALSGVEGLLLPVAPRDRTHVYHLYVVRLESAGRDAVARFLSTHGVETAVHYRAPVHLTPAFARLGYAAGDFPVAERAAATVLSLPMHPDLTEGDVRDVAELVRRAVTTPSLATAGDPAA